MKGLSFFSALCVVLLACNDQSATDLPQQNDSTITDTNKYSIQIPKSGCYLHTAGKDSIALKIERFPNVVTGMLNYNFFEKDRNTGTIEGVFKGDTLLADYYFESEGKRSIRQVIFLVRDSAVIEGYGDMEEKEGKMIFKNTANIEFSKGLSLRKIDCMVYDPSVTVTVVPVSGGSELLYSYRWELTELNGEKISNTAAHLLMSPGQINKVTGNAGCNSLRGTFELTGTRGIKFSPLMTTKMACPELKTETKLLEALDNAVGWKIEYNELSFNKGKTILAKFKGVEVSGE